MGIHKAFGLELHMYTLAVHQTISNCGFSAGLAHRSCPALLKVLKQRIRFHKTKVCFVPATDKWNNYASLTAYFWATWCRPFAPARSPSGSFPQGKPYRPRCCILLRPRPGCQTAAGRPSMRSEQVSFLSISVTNFLDTISYRCALLSFRLWEKRTF